MRSFAVLLTVLGGLALAGSAVAGRPTPPTHTGVPAIVGDAHVGRNLSATNGGWSGTAPIHLTYQWRDCAATGVNCFNIPGATAWSYTPVETDRGHALRVAVTAKNSAGSSSATS